MSGSSDSDPTIDGWDLTPKEKSNLRARVKVDTVAGAGLHDPNGWPFCEEGDFYIGEEAGLGITPTETHLYPLAFSKLSSTDHPHDVTSVTVNTHSSVTGLPDAVQSWTDQVDVSGVKIPRVTLELPLREHDMGSLFGPHCEGEVSAPDDQFNIDQGTGNTVKFILLNVVGTTSLPHMELPSLQSQSLDLTRRGDSAVTADIGLGLGFGSNKCIVWAASKVALYTPDKFLALADSVNC